MTPEEALAGLLDALFDDSELRRWLYHGPQGEEISQALSIAPATRAALNDEAVLALKRRGLIDQAFWDRLRGARPLQEAEIAAVEASWAGRASKSKHQIRVSWRAALVGGGVLALGAVLWLGFVSEVTAADVRAAGYTPVSGDGARYTPGDSMIQVNGRVEPFLSAELCFPDPIAISEPQPLVPGPATGDRWTRLRLRLHHATTRELIATEAAGDLTDPRTCKGQVFRRTRATGGPTLSDIEVVRRSLYVQPLWSGEPEVVGYQAGHWKSTGGP